MIAGAGSLQKLLHLANAREALASGDFLEALSEVDAAVAADATFAAAQSLRREILARMSTVPQPVVQAPRIPEQIATMPVQPQRRTRSPWPARARAWAAAATLFLVGVLAVMLVRSGGRGADVRAPELSSATTVSAAADVPLPRFVMPTTAPKAPVPVATPAPKASVAAKAEPASTAVESNEWASPRLTRLNVRPRWRASAVHVEDAALLKDLGEGISELWVGKLTGNEDAIFVSGSLDENDWASLRASLKPTGVVWRVYSHRSGPLTDAALVNAVAAGFTRGRQVRYSSDYVAEQFTPRARPLLGPARGRRSTQE
jgi:hypothetical protein